MPVMGRLGLPKAGRCERRPPTSAPAVGQGEGVRCWGSQALEGVVEEQKGNNSPAGLGLAEAWLGRAGRHPNRKQHRGSGSSDLSLRVGREQTALLGRPDVWAHFLIPPLISCVALDKTAPRNAQVGRDC